MMALLPVFAAGLVPFIVGSLWYHPNVFGTYWMRMRRVTPEMAERSSRLAFHSTGIMLIVGIFSAFMLSHVLYALGIPSTGEALATSFGIWLGFIVPATVGRVLWDHVPIKLYGVEAGQWLVSLLIMAAVLTI